MAQYRVSRGRVAARARSSLHDTTTTWTKLAGELEVLPDEPMRAAQARIVVDMREFDAGDRLKNWKLRSDLEPDRHPEAVFTLSAIEEAQPLGGGAWRAVARGTLAWRGRTTAVLARGEAQFADDSVHARATFSLDVTRLGVTPPKILFLKVENVVEVTVELTAELDAMRTGPTPPAA